MATAISVEHLSKTYRLGMIGGVSLNEDVARWWARIRRRPDPLLKVGERLDSRSIGEVFSALDDVSFDVEEGQVLGIIGRNGAGKSTLLKILSQVTAPTSGQITVRGRIASLLEVGTGFHPDLSGRENIFLNGAILGMTKAEIRRNFDAIVAFSECEQFIDTPVKRYSSGMYVRLAFAVAAHLEPEILIVDEVLAVGDAQFQKKCLGKMGEVSSGGRTVLFVSHNMVAVQSLCRKAILLRDGGLIADGPAHSVVGQYLREAYAQQPSVEWPSPETAPGNESLRVRAVTVTATARRTDGLIGMSSPINVQTDYWVLKGGLQLHLAYILVNDQGIMVLSTGAEAKRREPGLYSASFTVPGHLLNSGGYTLHLVVIQDENRLTYENHAIASFNVVEDIERGTAWFGRNPVVVTPRLPWTVARVS